MKSRIALLLFCAAAAISACRGGRGGPGDIEPLPARPLAGLVAQPLIVLPAHYLRGGDSIGWSAQVPEVRAYLAAFDSVLEKTFRDRGVTDSWRFPPELTRTAQRNAGYLANPYQLAAQGLRPPTRSSANDLTDPLASQLRAWVALAGARVALLPVEVRFEGARDSAQVVVRVVVIDARLARVSWGADVRSDFAASPGRESLISLARHVADLALPP